MGIPSLPTGRKSSPTQIPGTTWDKVFGGKEMLHAIKTDGTLWTWGENPSGSLGQNQASVSYTHLTLPTKA